MKLEKAIEILIISVSDYENPKHLDLYDAQNLGIAALTRIRYQRIKPTVPHKTLLPGED